MQPACCLRGSNTRPQFRMTIRPMEARHWPQVRAIYEAGLATGQASFATQAPRRPAWHTAPRPHSRLVALQPGERVLGWAALAPALLPYASPGVALPSLYVAPTAQGRGVGHALLAALVADSEAHGLWTLHALVFPENVGLQRLCERVGFQVMGRYTRIGQLHGLWRDLLLLERRSLVVGVADASRLPLSRPSLVAASSSQSARNTMGSVTRTHTGRP